MVICGQLLYRQLSTRDAQSRWILTETTDLHALRLLDDIGYQVPLVDVYAGLELS